MRCALLILLAGLASAGPKEADALKAEADQAFLDGDYVGALQRLESAYAADPRPGLIANKALVLEKLGEYGPAVEAMERFLESEPPPPARALAEEVIARLRPELRILSTPSGAKVSVRGEVLGETPLRTALLVGRHELSLEAHGYQTKKLQVNMQAGTAVKLDERLARARARRPTPAPVEPLPEARGSLRPWAWTSFGVGLVAVGAAGVFYGLGVSEVEARDEASSSSAWETHQASAESMNMGYVGGLSLAGVAVLVGGALWLMEPTAVSAEAGGLSWRF